MVGGEDTTTVLEGFTIRGGTGTPLEDRQSHLMWVEGGGVLIDNGSPIVRHNIIRDNVVERVPGGVTSAGGGGIRCGFGSPRILGNVVINNDGRYYGGGIVVNLANATLRNNIVANNRGGLTYGGGGVWVFGLGYTVQLENNTIVGNTAGEAGGGVYVSVSTVIAPNNIVWANNSVSSTSDQISGTGNNAQFRYSDVQGGRTGPNNFSANPQFADSNFRLLPTSPCIDAGDPDPLYNDSDGSRNDIGAYGGPGAAEDFPYFTFPLLALPTPVINFGVATLGLPREKNLVLANVGGNVLVIDSIRFVGDAGQTITFNVPIDTIRPATQDTFRIIWTPAAAAPLADTLLLYHNDTTTPNPARVPLSGIVTVVSVPEPRAELPRAYRLAGNFPNPFNSSTVIRFELPVASAVRVEIFDVLGRSVALLEDGPLSAGAYTLPWSPAGLASGTYICRFRAGDFDAERTLMLLK